VPITLHTRRKLDVTIDAGELAVFVRPMTGAEHIQFDALVSTNTFLRLSFLQATGATVEDAFARICEQDQCTRGELTARLRDARVEAFRSALEYAASVVVDWEGVEDASGNPVPVPETLEARRDMFSCDPFGEAFVLRVMISAVARARSDAGNGRGGSATTTAGSRTPTGSAGPGATESERPGGA
jgi:hypothetical protein